MRLALRRAAPGSRAFGTIKTDPATCLGPRPDLVDAPITFDPLQYAFDQGSATGQPVCGVVDDFLTEAECARLIALAAARGYESTEETIQLGGRRGRRNDKSTTRTSSPSSSGSPPANSWRGAAAWSTSLLLLLLLLLLISRRRVTRVKTSCKT